MTSTVHASPDVDVDRQSRTPPGVALIVRRPDFDFSTLPKYWFDGNPWKTHFGTALMLVFPSGEKFVVRGVRNYRSQVTDPKLKLEVTRFCGQESLHSREHTKLNEVLFQHFPRLRAVERFQDTVLEGMARVLPESFQLALSASIEHLTSSFGHQTLANRAEIEAMHPVPRELLIWHAIEEMEHKSVAFDVHEAMGGRHVVRVLGLGLILPMILATTYGTFLYLLAADGVLLDARMWKREFLDAQWKTLRRMLRGQRPTGLFAALPFDAAAFLRSDFHPWDIDDRHLIADSKRYDPMRNLAPATA